MINLYYHKFSVIAAFVSGCFFMGGCENDVNEVRELSRKKENIEEGKNISSYLSMDGKMRAHLTAPLMLRIQSDTGRRTEFPRSLHVDFYNDSTARIESQLRALYGNYLENQSKVFLRDSVVAFNVKGDTLFCKEMYWDQNLQKFYTDKEVTISQRYPKKRFSGVGMTCNQDLTNLTLFKIQPGSFAMIADSLTNGTDTTRK